MFLRSIPNLAHRYQTHNMAFCAFARRNHLLPLHLHKSRSMYECSNRACNAIVNATSAPSKCTPLETPKFTINIAEVSHIWPYQTYGHNINTNMCLCWICAPALNGDGQRLNRLDERINWTSWRDNMERIDASCKVVRWSPWNQQIACTCRMLGLACKIICVPLDITCRTDGKKGHAGMNFMLAWTSDRTDGRTDELSHKQKIGRTDGRTGTLATAFWKMLERGTSWRP